MTDSDRILKNLPDLEARERNIVLSFLSLSERPTPESTDAMDELVMSLAIKSSVNKSPN